MASSLKVLHNLAVPSGASPDAMLVWLMAEYGIPRELFPEEVETCDVDQETGWFSLRFGGGYTLSTANGALRVAPSITGFFRPVNDPSERGRIEKLDGMSVEKEVFGLRAVVDVESVCISDRGVVLIHALGPEIVPVDEFSRNSRCTESLSVDP